MTESTRKDTTGTNIQSGPKRRADTHTGSTQAQLWNGVAGRAWIDAQESLDRLFTPFEELLCREVATRVGADVLDVGCGTGATTIAAARVLGSSGRCVGVDLSAPMIEVAKQRAQQERTPPTFICADAQVYPFTPGSCDLIVSRFGVMFFDDPIAAFANLRRAATDGGELRVIAWRSPGENAFMTTAERAAAPVLPDLPQRQPGAAGQFAFADAGRVRNILEESGWKAIEIAPIDVPCTLPENELLQYVTRLGPVGMFLRESDDQTRTRVAEAVRPAFDAFVHGNDVRFTAACWMIGARAR
jgi:ubiquinone/menaquinone biosynthesis C-methylase UbiE